MSIIDQVRDHFKENPGARFDNAGLREALDIDDSAHISMALNALHNAGELKRDKKDGHGFDYWLASGAAPAARLLSPKDVASKLVKQRAEAKPAKSKKVKSPKAKKVKVAKKPRPVRAVADEGGGLADSAVPAGAAAFAMRHDGELGIHSDGIAVNLRRADVQRLKEFMTTVAPLWQ